MAHEILVDFVRAARGAGVRVSPAETLDAVRAADLVGYGSRTALHDALAATMAKSADELALFNEVFDRFFAARRMGDLDGEGAGDASGDETPADDTAHDDMASGDGAMSGAGGGGSGMAAPQSELAQMLMRGDEGALQTAMSQAAMRARLAEIRLFTQRGLFGRRLFQEMGGEALDIEIIAADESGDAAQAALAAELKRRRQLLRDAIREQVTRQYLLSAAQANRELREEMIREASLATLHEFRDVEKIVRKLARRIAARHSRRRRVERRGLLDVRRTLARNIRHDGVLFEPQWRHKRIDRPDVMVVCDVSNSVRAYAKFLLLFLYSLSDVLPRVRSFAFSYRLGEVTDWFRTLEFDDAVGRTMQAYGLGSTDYGLALESLEELCLDAVGPRTTLIFLGDARSNYSEPRVDILRLFSARARQVIWLNPEHPARWGSGDSVMPRYRPHCQVAASVRSLDDLERVVERLLKRA